MKCNRSAAAATPHDKLLHPTSILANKRGPDGSRVAGCCPEPLPVLQYVVPFGRGTPSLALGAYLPVLGSKPGDLPVTVLAVL
jgi:hypothetical protein